MKSIPYGKQFIDNTDIEAVVDILKSDFLTQGPKIQEFEEKFAKKIGAKYAVAVSNGTAALHLSALSVGVNQASKVITSPITFSASANCIRYCGGEVIFEDINPENLLLDPIKVRKLLEISPKGTYSGIIPVDFAGFPVDMQVFRELADEFGLWIIEDSCHSPGGYFIDKFGNRHYCGDGSLADLAIFSFHPVKHIATGEGGMITTNREDLYEKLLRLRTHGIVKDPKFMSQNPGGWYMELQELGYNYRLTDFQAALGISQLSRLDWSLERRHAIAKKYDQLFEFTEIKTVKIASSIFHAYHLYVIQTRKRLELYEFLKQRKILCQVHYIPVHLMPYYAGFGWKKGDFPISESYYEQCLSLPMYPTLSEEEQDFVIISILEFIKNL